MFFWDILYIVAIILFVYLTFGIVRGYFKNKFDENDRRIDMKDETDNEDKKD